MKKIYFDYSASTPVCKQAFEAMMPYSLEKFGNPSSLHSFGGDAIAAIDKAREKAAQAISADFREIIFTSSATEANNLALRGIVKGIRNLEFGIWNFNPRIIVSSIEHESVLETARGLEQEGAEIIYLPVDKNGVVDLQKLKKSLNKQTILVSVMYANNITGAIQPISKISEIIRNFREESKIKNKELKSPFPIFHTDAVQAFQYLDCDVNKLGIDLMTTSSHKIYGPKGAGLLYCRRDSLKAKSYKLKAILTGGEQEFGLRSGTENVPAIVGFGEAIKLVLENRAKELKRVWQIKKYFWQRLKKAVPDCKPNPEESIKDETKFLPSILNVYFPGFKAQNLVALFDSQDIAVSSGSACSARTSKSSYVLKEMGFSEERRESSIRFSFGRETTKEIIDDAIGRIQKIFKCRN